MSAACEGAARTLPASASAAATRRLHVLTFVMSTIPCCVQRACSCGQRKRGPRPLLCRAAADHWRYGESWGQSGTAMAPAVMAITLAAVGVAAGGGTLAALMAGALPGVPPRGTVRTTWLGGRALPLARWSYTASSAWFRYACSGT